MPAKRSPIKLHCEWLLPPAEAAKILRETPNAVRPRDRNLPFKTQLRREFRICKWRCIAPVRGARFVERRRPDSYALVHPSTQEPGRWQISYFDSLGPVGHTTRDTCSEAVAHLRPWQYRLKKVF